MINVLTFLEGGIHRLFKEDFSCVGLIAVGKLMRNMNFLGNELDSRAVSSRRWRVTVRGTIPAVLG